LLLQKINYEEKTTTDGEEHPEELETAADDFLQKQSEESTYKQPMILLQKIIRSSF